MNEKKFGELLQELRLQRNLSRDALAEGICSTRQLQRIENSDSEPSLLILNGLSMKLNIDLQEIYANQCKYNESPGYEDILALDELIRTAQFQELRKHLETLSISEIEDNTFLLEMYEYCQAVCSYHLDNDYEATNHHLNQGLALEYPIKKGNLVSDYRFSNYGYTLLNLKARVLAKLEGHESSTELYLQIMQSLERFFLNEEATSYISPFFINNMYQAILLNLLINYYQTEQFEEAKTYLEKGLAFSVQKQLLYNFPGFFEYKAKILALEGNQKEADKYLTAAKIVYKTQGFVEYAEKLSLPELTTDK